MSQIDQAFLKAYHRPTGVEPPAAESLRSPHFEVSDGFDSYDQIPSQPATDSIATIAMPLDVAPGERRPLSSYAAPTEPSTTAFRPIFEVDRFGWPAVVDKLLASQQDIFAPVVEQIRSAAEVGIRMVGIAGCRSGIGCTTVLLSLARKIAQRGKRVAMVDANFAAGNLADTLGLELDAGWEDALTGRTPLAECVVRSMADDIALLPLRGPVADPIDLLAGIQTSISAGVLRHHYEVVLFDLGSVARPPQLAAVQQIVEQCRLDASIAVTDMSATGTSAGKIDQLLSVLGATCLGLVANRPGR